MKGIVRVFGRGAVSPAGTLGVLLLAGVVSAAAQSASEETASENTTTNQPAFQVDVRRNVEGTYIPYRFAFITSGSEKFTFLIPEGYRVDTTDPVKIKLASPDYSGMIIVGVSGGGQPAGAKLEPDTLRARVLARDRKSVV